MTKGNSVMKELTRAQNFVFLIGGLLMVVGAGASMFRWGIAPYIYSVGALAFTAMQMLQHYEGRNFTIRRLRRIMLLSDLFFLVSAVLMFASQGNPLGLSQVTYLQYVYQRWVVTLLIAAVLQLYSVHRINHELEREAKKL